MAVREKPCVICMAEESAMVFQWDAVCSDKCRKALGRMTCIYCGGRVEMLNDGVNRWLVHETHPADGHDATALTWVSS